MSETTTTGTATQTNGTATTTQGEAEPAWAKTLNENIGKMLQGVESIKSLSEESAKAQRAAATADDEPEDEASTLDDPNLDLLPMSQVARRILGEVEGVVEKALKPVTEQINATRVTAESTKITGEVQDFASRTPDFGEFGEEMAKVATQYPTMHISDIYNLAKVRSPEKVAKLAKAASDAKAAAEARNTVKKPLMSLSPGGPTGEVVNEKMSPGDAAKAAWDETVEKFGGSPFQAG